jgi:hypothetical protein
MRNKFSSLYYRQLPYKNLTLNLNRNCIQSSRALGQIDRKIHCVGLHRLIFPDQTPGTIPDIYLKHGSFVEFQEKGCQAFAWVGRNLKLLKEGGFNCPGSRT